MPTFGTPGPIVAVVQVAGAHVRVIAGDRTETVVLVEPIDKNNPSHLKVADRTQVDFVDGRLKVRTTVSGHKDGSIAITIELPTESSLIGYTAHSSVRADGRLGDFELHTAKGQVQLDRINSLQANVAAGELTVGHIAGDARIEGSVVAVRIDAVEGAAKLSNSGGQTWIGHASADLDLSSTNGGFDIDRADGSVTARTANGAIRIGRLVRGPAALSNSSGNIEVGIREGSSVLVDADSVRGKVRNCLPASKVSDDLVRIHARTRHGDIVVRRAAG